jgi:hypothetical protein
MVLAHRGATTRAKEHAEAALALGTELGMIGPYGAMTRAQAVLADL